MLCNVLTKVKVTTSMEPLSKVVRRAPLKYGQKIYTTSNYLCVSKQVFYTSNSIPISAMAQRCFCQAALTAPRVNSLLNQNPA